MEKKASEKGSASVFLLTGDSQEAKGRFILRFYGRSPELGAVELTFDNMKLVFFVEREAELPTFPFPFRRSPVALQSFQFREVDALYFETQKELLQARDLLEQKNITTFEADIHPCDRFLMERFIYGQTKVTGEARQEGRLTRFLNPELRPEKAEDPSLKIVSIDIETGVESRELYSIAVHFTGEGEEKKRIFMLSRGGNHRLKEMNLSLFSSEKELLTHFLAWFQAADPDILIGWNVVGFDLAYLEKKCQEFRLPFALGRADRTAYVRKRQSGGFYAVVPGRVVLDGPVVLRAAFYSFEDYSLETVAQELLGEGKKIAEKGKSKIAEIERLFAEDKEGLAQYNLQDAVLVTRIFEKTGLIALYVKRSRISGLLMDQIGMSTAAFDHFYLPKLHRRGFVAPNVRDIHLSEHAAGGYVFPPKSGLYEHVLVFDFKSLYPSIIRTFHIDPLSRLLADPSKNETVVTPKGFRFSRGESILPAFITELMEERARAAAKKDAHLSQAIKILMNSFYGVMGSAGCRFYHPDLPTAITSTGQWLLIGSKDFLESKGLEVLYGDTDSLFARFSYEKKIVPEKLGAKLAEELDAYWKERLAREFNVTSCLEVKFEKHYLRFLLPRARSGEGGAKKRYAGLLLKKDEEKLEFTGMEFVRSDWTKLAKEFQHELYWRLFHDEEIEKWMRQLVQEVRQGKRDEQLVYRKRLRKSLEEYTESQPPHVKAARMLDHPVREVRYLMTKRGPVPVELSPRDLDYQHYIEKQLEPIADAILSLHGRSFDEITSQGQLSLF